MGSRSLSPSSDQQGKDEGLPFSEAIIQAAWTRSAGICECSDIVHGHAQRCSTRLLWTLQGGELGGGWQAVRKASWGTDVLANCEIRCVKCQGR